MTDNSSHKGSEEVLVADIIAEMAWGIIEHTNNNGVIKKSWKCTSDKLSVTAPAKNLVTYREFLIKEFPLKTEKDEPNKELMRKFNLNQKRLGCERLLRFVSPENPGERFKKVFDEIMEKLSIPEHLKDQLEGEEGKLGELTYKEAFGNGKYKIIPSFFKLIGKLKEAQRDFVIIFRSFGSDLTNTITEFNRYIKLKTIATVKEIMCSSMTQSQNL